MSVGRSVLLTLGLAACLTATPAQAQTPTPPPQISPASAPSEAKASHWGIVFSATPSWYLPSSITNNIAKDGGGVTLVGTQFTVGIVRGRSTSGDWGVTFVHEPVRDGSNGFSSDTKCGFANGPMPGGCFNTSGGAVAQGVKMNGVQIHKYIPFRLIKGRVQIGIDLAGGFGKLSGTLQKTSSDTTNIQTNPKTGQRTALLSTTVTTESVTAELPGKVPLGRLTFVAAAIIHPAIKVRWEFGMLMPGETFSTVMVTYLFGAHH
jgi:hypothetical protein